MGRTNEVEADGADAVVIKRATGPDVAALRAAAERLTAAAHPGVVEVLTSRGSGDDWELRLAHGGRPLDTVGPLGVEQVARVAAAVAATLADLHDAGIAHGEIDGSHVLLGAHGRPVLCGFAPAGAAEPADDVAALGSLMVALLGTDGDFEPIPDRRWRRPRSSGSWARRSLLLLADQACAEPATRRPSARRLAAAIAEAVPGAAVVAEVDHPTAPGEPGSHAPTDDPLDALRAGALAGAPRPPARLPALACAVAGALVLLAAGVRLARPDAVPARSVAAAPATTEADAATTLTTAPVPAPREIPPTTTAAVSPPPPCVPDHHPADGAGCAVPLVLDGTTVLVGDRRYEVGRPGDLVVLGDWDCDGAATPALLRPASGEVFVFPIWAGAEGVTVHAIERVEGATELLAERNGAGCSDLVVRRADGSRQPIPGEDLS